MFTIKLKAPTSNRTVLLTKTQVEMDGESKVIVMVRDVTDKVRLEQEQIRKGKEYSRSFNL